MRVETPSAAQAEAGNYKKGHLRWQGMEITVETPKGGTRRAKDNSWKVENFPADYGYIRKTEGADGDHVDLYLGDSRDSPMLWVIDQVDAKTKKFDEHKVMGGFKKRADAVECYHRGFSDGKAADRIGNITPMTVDEFKRWLEKGDTSRPLAGAFS